MHEVRGVVAAGKGAPVTVETVLMRSKTGSVRRIGRATALALSRLGAAVVIHARASRDEAERTRAEVGVRI